MPELPEVETTRRGVEPLLKGHSISNVIIRNFSLRFPIDRSLPQLLIGQTLTSIGRRAKYLYFYFDHGCLIWHLGMSGSMRVHDAGIDSTNHDHVDLVFDNGLCLRYRDPRRFGLVVWTRDPPDEHKLIRHLGPEPWDENFNGKYLYRISRSRKLAVKNFIMDGKVVVGVGNIYASESLFLAGIDPRRGAHRVAQARYAVLADTIRNVLEQAINKGGTTLKDFVKSDGNPGYFRQELCVYDRTGNACINCQTQIRQLTIGQRSSFYCPSCQR